MRTFGRRIRSGERSRAECDYCGTPWDRRKLYRDEAGLLTCPQEGRGRDAVALTRANAASAQIWAARKVPQPHDPGRYTKEVLEAEHSGVFSREFSREFA
jgi:hypothetical protein